MAGGKRARTAKEGALAPRTRVPGPAGLARPAGPGFGKRGAPKGRRAEGGRGRPRKEVRRGDGSLPVGA
eukprot:13445914-Heterocapsa_arctica.AAC.1